MRLLLDTHALLWALSSPGRLRREAREAIEAGANDVSVSSATVWEIEIKRALGKLAAPDDIARGLAASGFDALPITVDHAVVAGRLPRHHEDPFDRMLVAQAQVEGLTLVTRDPRFALYGVPALAA